MSVRSVRFLRAAIVLALPLPLWAAPLNAQNEFDIDVARVGLGGRFEPFRVTETEPLRGAISANKLRGDTRVLVLEHPAGLLAFLTDQMVYHHVAQGETNGEPWMVSF
mgnify:CR=1 FL=1|jgi:hypothetical protein